jgi:CRP/FNR family transcriptional regulator, cyclic AMP receptor protein
MSASLDFLGQLGDEERRALEAIATRRTAAPGQHLMAAGQVADHVIVVRAGHMKIVAPGPQGEDVVLAFRGPGSLIGEQALVDGSPRSAGVVAVEPVELLVIPASAFRRFLVEHPRVAMVLVGMLSLRLRDSDRQLVRFATSDTLGRTSARLVELCDHYGDGAADGSVRISLPLTQEDLAGWTGSSLESTEKALRAMRRLQWISTARRSITVHDVEALRQRAR